MTIDIGSLTQDESLETFKELMLVLPPNEMVDAIMDGFTDDEKSDLLVRLEEWDSSDTDTDDTTVNGDAE